MAPGAADLCGVTPAVWQGRGLPSRPVNRSGVYYPDYLKLDQVLNAQVEESKKVSGQAAHEEHLFIVIHQGTRQPCHDDVHAATVLTPPFMPGGRSRLALSLRAVVQADPARAALRRRHFLAANRARALDACGQQPPQARRRDSKNPRRPDPRARDNGPDGLFVVPVRWACKETFTGAEGGLGASPPLRLIFSPGRSVTTWCRRRASRACSSASSRT